MTDVTRQIVAQMRGAGPEPDNLIPTQLAPIAEIRAQLERAQHRELIKQKCCPGASDLEFAHCMAMAIHLGLDPILGQIYFIPVYDSKERREVRVPVVSIHGLRSIAQRTGEYEGRTPPQWCGQDAQWVDIWLADTPPAGARIGVYRSSFREPLYSVVTYREFCRRKKDGTPMALWATHPAYMLSKCCESASLRAAFPREMAGDYGVQDVSMPGEPGRFRVKDTTDKVAAQVAPKQSVATLGSSCAKALIELIEQAETLDELAILGDDAKLLPEAERAEARKAWVAAKERIEAAEAKPPSEPSEHDYGPAPMTEAERAAIEAGEQTGFGFDGK